MQTCCLPVIIPVTLLASGANVVRQVTGSELIQKHTKGTSGGVDTCSLPVVVPAALLASCLGAVKLRHETAET